MKGISFIIDDSGERTAVQIDLRQYGDIWEYFYDTLIALEKLNEPTEPIEAVEKRLKSMKKIRVNSIYCRTL
ncbi:hypothetical protein ISS30_03910 [bacterium]|nr:hypothetical protein [bacterium]